MLVRRLAVGKALAVAGPRPPTDVVLAGDTVVASDGRILGKPVERHAAAAMLLGLSGRVHQAVSAVAVARGGAHPDDVRSEVATTHVTFRELDRADLDWYLASQEWHGKAGAYGLQGSAAVFVTELRGLDTTVIGLPLGPAVSLLRDQGFDPLRPPA